jgi:halogenation protein CepH
VISDDTRVRGLRCTDPAGRSRTILARHVVDASGNTSRIRGQAGGKRVYSDFFRNLAVFGYWAGGGRLPAPEDGNIFCVAVDEGWLWYIPLRDDLTSVGAVVSPDSRRAVQEGAEAAWLRVIRSSPEISELLAGVPRATGQPYDQVRVRKDYSYWTERFWTPGMVLTGDAACFVDPVLSSGVHLATYSALLAARAINSSLAGDVPEDRAFAEFETRYRREYGLFYEFLASFYDIHVDERSYFWKAKKITNVAKGELESFVELAGGLASGDSPLVTAGDVTGRLAKASADLETVVARHPGSDDRGNPVYESESVRNVFQEGAAIQDAALYGPAPDGRKGELIPSPDGLSWVVA